MLVRRVPHGTLQQAGTLLLSGLALTPLIPSATGRALAGQPLARALTEALGFRTGSGARGRRWRSRGLDGRRAAHVRVAERLGYAVCSRGASSRRRAASADRVDPVDRRRAAARGIPRGRRARPPLRAAPARPGGRPAPRADRGLRSRSLGPPSRREVAVALIVALTVDRAGSSRRGSVSTWPRWPCSGSLGRCGRRQLQTARRSRRSTGACCCSSGSCWGLGRLAASLGARRAGRRALVQTHPPVTAAPGPARDGVGRRGGELLPSASSWSRI